MSVISGVSLSFVTSGSSCFGLKTELKKELKAFAFSDCVVAVDPSLLTRVGICLLDVSLELTCFQNFLGAVFASLAIFFSCSLSAYLVALQFVSGSVVLHLSALCFQV